MFFLCIQFNIIVSWSSLFKEKKKHCHVLFFEFLDIWYDLYVYGLISRLVKYLIVLLIFFFWLCCSLTARIIRLFFFTKNRGQDVIKGGRPRWFYFFVNKINVLLCNIYVVNQSYNQPCLTIITKITFLSS